MNQTEFNKLIADFNSIEDTRDQLWDRARKLFLDGYELEADIVILATWNFARFRYFMKNFDLNKFQKTIESIKYDLTKLKDKRLMNIDLDNPSQANLIKKIYNNLKDVVEQTGATKLMAIRNHNLFVMWDTEIRRIYKIEDNGKNAESYITFLKQIKDRFWKIRVSGKTPLAKSVDECNYVLADKIRSGKLKLKTARRLIGIK